MSQRRTSCLLAMAVIAAALAPWPASAETHAIPKAHVSAGPLDGELRVSMRNVVLYPYDDVPATVASLTGRVLAERPHGPIVMDDTASYRVDTDYAEMRLTADGMTRLMNRHILPGARTPIHEVNVAFGDGVVSMSGTMVKLGTPVPFTATATLEPTAAGDLRVHIATMKSAGIIPKTLLDGLGLELDTLAQPANRGVFHIEGDDMIVPVISMFPPPRLAGG